MCFVLLKRCVTPNGSDERKTEIDTLNAEKEIVFTQLKIDSSQV